MHAWIALFFYVREKKILIYNMSQQQHEPIIIDNILTWIDCVKRKVKNVHQLFIKENDFYKNRYSNQEYCLLHELAHAFAAVDELLLYDAVVDLKDAEKIQNTQNIVFGKGCNLTGNFLSFLRKSKCPEISFNNFTQTTFANVNFPSNHDGVVLPERKIYIYEQEANTKYLQIWNLLYPHITQVDHIWFIGSDNCDRWNDWIGNDDSKIKDFWYDYGSDHMQIVYATLSRGKKQHIHTNVVQIDMMSLNHHQTFELLHLSVQGINFVIDAQQQQPYLIEILDLGKYVQMILVNKLTNQEITFVKTLRLWSVEQNLTNSLLKQFTNVENVEIVGDVPLVIFVTQQTIKQIIINNSIPLICIDASSLGNKKFYCEFNSEKTCVVICVSDTNDTLNVEHAIQTKNKTLFNDVINMYHEYGIKHVKEKLIQTK